jgi:hypothetical protein
MTFNGVQAGDAMAPVASEHKHGLLQQVEGFIVHRSSNRLRQLCDWRMTTA